MSRTGGSVTGYLLTGTLVGRQRINLTFRKAR